MPQPHKNAAFSFHFMHEEELMTYPWRAFEKSLCAGREPEQSAGQ
jgi:hypothetical protein